MSELHLLDISPKSVHFIVVNRGLKREDRGEDHSCWWQPLICGFSRYVGNFLKMWAEELLMIEKMVTSLQNPSAHISGKLPTYLEKARPLEKIPFWGGKRSKIVPNFLYGLVTYITGIFQKNNSRNWSVLPSAVPKRFYTRLYGVATTN